MYLVGTKKPRSGFPAEAHYPSKKIHVASRPRDAGFDLTDFEWSVIEPLLPNKPRGVRPVDDFLHLATAFLAYDAAKLITGETFSIDGGYHVID